MGRKCKDRFTGKMFARLLAPAMVSSAGLAVADMADAIVVGQRMGATGLAAVSLALPVYMIINVFVHGLGIGGSVKYSRLLGEGKTKEASDSFNQILETALLISLCLALAGCLFLEPFLRMLGVSAQDGDVFLASREYVRTLLCGMPVLFLSYILNYYLRNDDHQKLASIGFTAGNLADFGMNVLFVLVFDFGAFGAALSTVLGQLLSVIIYLPGISVRKHFLRIKPVGIRLKEAFSCFRTGFSTSVQYIWQMLFLLLVNHTLMYYSGENGVAVFDLVQNVSYLILYLYDGVVRAMQPLVSTYQGERNREGSRSIRRMGILYGTAAGLLSSAVLFLFPDVMCRVFGLAGADIMPLAARAIRVYCLGGIFGGLNILLEGYYQSCENERPAFWLATLRGAVILIPCTVLFAPFGIGMFWFLFPVTEILSLLVFVLMRKRNQEQERFEDERVYGSTIEGNEEELGNLLGEVEQFCGRWNANRRQRYYMTMTVEEICLLIIRKGFEEQGGGYIQITLIALPDQEFELHIRDNAKIFNPFSLETDKVSEEGEYDMDAMGMLVIKQKAKQFFYRQYQGFNSLIVRV